ncbi:Helix-turn-helix domain-containing protein [Prauserella marina]|uniref:Helix-turn-helix domain-containing protein n=1 Tax=Prauserella marina TaxID=530584 RepID=A0A1G6YBK0_9PSEU|nr:metalloregulator ArsR/SmtB family transcription factor [Prauserella marina]PWV79925.1 ArsR family transcriptional regulator [Prauserella marina]SDD86966.1 Helix-turn-helix domain-containing protein [Prauserella marina]
MRAATAIADPVRRDILVLLGEGPRSAGDIAARFAISRPAVSRHLRVLRECGLLVAETTGRQRMYSLDTTPLTELAGWLSQFGDADPSARRWQNSFDALETEVHRARRDRANAPERTDPREDIA